MYEEGFETENRDHISMFDKNSLQCPFTWSPRTEVTSEKMIYKFEHKLDAVDTEGETVAWTKFILNMILCYEYSNLGQIDKASQKEKECENIIDDPQLTNSYILSAKEAFKHVYLSCKFFLLEKNLLKEESEEVLRDIIRVNKMNNKEKATVWSIGSAFLMEYGPRSTKNSVCFVKKALQLDPDCAEWYFLLGKVLGRIRQVKEGPNRMPEDDEIEALQSAIDKSQDPFYKVILAQTYLQMGRAMYYNRMYNEINNVLTKSSLLYREALEDGGNNPFVLRKCSEGFSKLPGSFKDTQLSKECIFRALEIAPTAGVFHVAGMVLQEENSDLAKQYLTRAIESGHSPSCFYLLRIKHKENKSYNPCADIERYLSLFTSDSDKLHFFAWLGAYHYYVKDDFDAALENWGKLFNITTASYVLTKFHSPWNIRTWSYNISEIILKEITERKRDPRYENQQTKYQNILQDLERHL